MAGSVLILDDNAFCNRYGSLRLGLVRKHFGLRSDVVGSYVDKNGLLRNVTAKVQLKRLDEYDLSEITRLYVGWRDLAEYMAVRYAYRDQRIVYAPDINTTAELYSRYLSNSGIRTSVYQEYVFFDGSRYEWEFHKSCKRGNDVYIKEVRRKFKPLLEMEPLLFFDTTINDNRRICRHTNMLYITGTVDPKLLPMEKAWLNFGSYWNDFITNIKKQFKGVVYIRAWQSQSNGYPHWHAILYFKNTDFSVVPDWSSSGKLSWRISSRQKLHKGDKLTIRQRIKGAWKIGNIDIECISNTHDCFKDLLKYVTRDLEGGESNLTNAMVWYFGRQSFAVSKHFIERVYNKKECIDLAEPNNADLINAISTNSNSDLVSIEIFPVLPASFFSSFYQSSLVDWAAPPDPPPELVDRLDDLLEECSASFRKRADGVKIIVYRRRK